MNEFSQLHDYTLTVAPRQGSFPRHPAPKRTAHGRTARKALAAGLHRLGDRLGG